jgi:hypothetical protein
VHWRFFDLASGRAWVCADQARVERYAHVAPNYRAKAANRRDALLSGYDLATREKENGSAANADPL